MKYKYNVINAIQKIRKWIFYPTPLNVRLKELSYQQSLDEAL